MAFSSRLPLAWWLTTIVVTVLAATGSPLAEPADGQLITINGRAVPCQPPLIWSENTAYLPDDFLSHLLGVRVEQIPETHSWLLRAYGRSLRLQPGKTNCFLGYEVLVAAAAPRVVDGHLYVPLELLTTVYDIKPVSDQPLGVEAGLQLDAPAGQVLDIRCGSHPDKARIVIDLDGPATYLWGIEHNGLLLDIAGPSGQFQDHQQLLTFGDELVDRIHQSLTGDGFTRIIISYHSPLAPVVFTLADPYRIIVDIPRPAPPEPAQPQIPSAPEGPLRWQIRNFGTPRGAIRVYVVEVDPTDEAIIVRPALAGTTVHQHASVRYIAQQQGAAAAINGGFYARQGPPLGLLIVDGEWIKPPMLKRTALGITADGQLLMNQLDFDGRLYFKQHGYLRLTGLNQGHGNADSLVVYTRRWGQQLAGQKNSICLVVSGSDEVTAKETDGAALEIPADGFVISAQGKYARLVERVQVGERVSLRLRTKPQWENVCHALGAGPRLVKDGQICITSGAERFRSDIANGICARSAVGITEQGKLLLVAVEPAPESEARGMTLAELATTMIKLGAWQAMNLDGGGSSTIVVGGQVLNRPPDGWLRRVSNALLVITQSTGAVTTQAESE